MDALNPKQKEIAPFFVPWYLLRVKGESMAEEGIHNKDWVLVEHRSYADNGEIVVARVGQKDMALKRIQQFPNETLLIPANAKMQATSHHPDMVKVHGVVIGKISVHHCPLNPVPFVIDTLRSSLSATRKPKYITTSPGVIQPETPVK